MEQDINVIVPQRSYNVGSVKGSRVLLKSIKQLGCCRSIVTDRNNIVLVGDKVLKIAKQAGITKVRIVETMGDELVVVKRKDIDADTRKAKEIALVDNLTSELNLNYDTQYLLQQMQDVWGFDPRVWEGHSCLVQELSVEDCIKEGLAAVDRKEQQTKEQESASAQDVEQFLLF